MSSKIFFAFFKFMKNPQVKFPPNTMSDYKVIWSQNCQNLPLSLQHSFFFFIEVLLQLQQNFIFFGCLIAILTQ